VSIGRVVERVLERRVDGALVKDYGDEMKVALAANGATG
jgi:hypothetical protein